jgi:hypothetical protein
MPPPGFITNAWLSRRRPRPPSVVRRVSKVIAVNRDRKMPLTVLLEVLDPIVNFDIRREAGGGLRTANVSGSVLALAI